MLADAVESAMSITPARGYSSGYKSLLASGAKL